tara:strand:- start:283 stop:912 length:630 start_codon:yes stop_codon:yes gene_type:complete
MNKKFKNKEKGFALPLALLLLVVMGLMSSILISKTTTEHRANTTKDLGQQAFYAAESGIAEAKKWMVDNSDTLKTKNPSDIDGNLRFCTTSMFPNIISGSKGFRYEKRNLSDIIVNLSQDEAKRLNNFSYEYFITYSPDVSGATNTAKTKTAAKSEGTSITEGTSYKKSGTNTATYYTIYSCGCNNSHNKCDKNKDTLVRLEQEVTLVN